MSRIGKETINDSKGVTVNIADRQLGSKGGQGRDENSVQKAVF